MKLGIFTVNGAYDLKKRIELAKTLGVRGISINDGEYAGREKFNACIGLAEKNDIDIVHIGAFCFNPLMPTEADGERFKQALELCGQIGKSCSVILGAGGLNKSNPWIGTSLNWKSETRQMVAENLKPYIEIAERLGAYISLEPHFSNAAYSGEVCKDIVKRTGSNNVKITFDIVNFCKYDDYFNLHGLIDKIIEPLMNNCVNAHIKDVKLEERLMIHMDECRVGQGEMDFVYLLRKLDSLLDENHTVCIEDHQSDEQGLRESVDFIRQCADKAGVGFKD